MGDETRNPVLTPASLIKSTRQRWLWEDRIPLGSVSIFAGRGGEGKSSFALHLLAELNHGRLEGDFLGRPTSAIVVALEDDWGTVMKPRLVAAGADLDSVYKLSVATTMDEVTRETAVSLPLDIDLIRSAVEETAASVIVLDPATSLMAGDMNKREDARRSLDALLQLAQDTNCTFILVVHFGKGTGNVSEKISGSHALRDAARSVLLFATDEESGQRVVSLDKSNYSRGGSSSFAFDLVDTSVETDDGDTAHVARVHFLGDTDISVSDIVNRGRDDDEERSESERWLIGLLEDAGGSATASDIKKAAMSDGMSWDSLKRASLRITTKAKQLGKNGRWLWTLDLTKGSSKGAKGARAQEPAPFAPFAQLGENVTALHPSAADEEVIA